MQKITPHNIAQTRFRFWPLWRAAPAQHQQIWTCWAYDFFKKKL